MVLSVVHSEYLYAVTQDISSLTHIFQHLDNKNAACQVPPKSVKSKLDLKTEWNEWPNRSAKYQVSSHVTGWSP